MQRVLSVSGVADAIHIATYYIGNILIEANERMPSRSDSSYRPSSYRRAPTYSGSSYVPGYSNPYPAGGPSHSHNPPQQLQTQQIYIPNDLVGCIIGKGGAKINEIRHMSASNIKIMEPGAVGVGVNGAPAPAGSEGERLVVITGQPANIQMAVQLLYHVRLFSFSLCLCLGSAKTDMLLHGRSSVFFFYCLAFGAGEAETDAHCAVLVSYRWKMTHILCTLFALWWLSFLG